jgi:hypothetical protein
MTKSIPHLPSGFLLGIVFGLTSIESHSFQIPVPMKYQAYAYWCWAASDAMVTEYGGGLPVERRTDVGVVSRAIGLPYNYCSIQSDGLPPLDCRITGQSTLLKPTSFLPRFNSISPSSSYSLPYTWSRVKTELDKKKPVQWSYANPGSSTGHTVVVVGYQEGSPNLLFLNDPVTGPRSVTQAEYEGNQLRTVFNFTYP